MKQLGLVVRAESWSCPLAGRMLRMGVLMVAGGSGLIACASQSPAIEKQIGDLRDRVLILQNERDRLEERIAALESLRDERPTSSTAADPGHRPPLRVVRVEPGDTPAPSTLPTSPESTGSEGVVAISGTGSELVSHEQQAPETVLVNQALAGTPPRGEATTPATKPAVAPVSKESP